MLKQLTAAICVLNSKYIHSSLAPWCLNAGIEAYCKKEITAHIVEGTINEPLENVAQRIISLNPQVIGCCCYIWNIAVTKQLITYIKKQLPDAIVVLGGPEVSYNADQLLSEEPLVEYIVSGEGEKPFALLLNELLENKRIFSSIPGLCYRQGKQNIVAAPNTPKEIPPSPYTDQYFHALKGRIAYLETSRGCPYTCAFCLSGRCGSVRYYDLGRAENELLLLANSGTQTVKLVDRTFNANPKRANELFQFIIDNYGSKIPNGVCFHFEIAGDILDEDTIALLSSAPVGAIQLEIGLQSFNSQTLSAIHRKTDVEKLKTNIQLLLDKQNMHIHIDLIAGLPYEDYSGFVKSFSIAYSLKPNMLQLGFLKLLHGAPMRENPEEYPCRFSKQPPYTVTETPWISKEELESLHDTEDALERLYNSGRFRRTVGYILNQTKINPFELYSKFGKYSAGIGIDKITLNEYTTLVFQYFSSMDGIDKAVLRDIMVCDRLATNASGILPSVLGVNDSELKRILKEWKKSPELCPKKGVKRGAALLYTENCAVYADYENKNPVSGEYTLHKINLQPL